jgi:hypothetical protein
MMKLRSLAIAGAVMALAFAGPMVANASSTATWAIAASIHAPGGFEYVNPVCTFVSHGDAFKGSCAGASNAGPASGSTDGPRVIFRWWHTPKNPKGWKGISTFKGVLGHDGIIRGTWIDTSMGHWVGDWSAKKIH